MVAHSEANSAAAPLWEEPDAIPESLGTTPSARAAASSKRQLGRCTLDSALAILDGLVRHGAATAADLADARDALERLRGRLANGDATVEVVEPVFYEWYFRGIAYVKRGALRALRQHVRALPAIATVPLARCGVLDEKRGPPLAVTVPHDGLLLSERVAGRAALAALYPGPASIATDGDVLRVRQDGAPTVDLDWTELVRFATFPVECSPITLWQASPMLDRVVADCQRDLARIHVDARPFHVLSPDELSKGLYGRYAERFRCGLDVIRRCWPELYDETCALTNHFTLIRGAPFIGGSSIACLGVSFFKLLPEWSDVCFADHIVHEAAHQRLHVEFEVEPALSNGAFVGAVSPIRRDPRPLYGVLHATFVFLRLSLFFERVIEVEYSPEAERRLHRHVLGLYTGLEQLDRYGEWNPRGVALFDSMYAVADRLRRKIPIPDAALYSDLGPDYEPVRELASGYHD
jgi:HEXXH motif-containing protein